MIEPYTNEFKGFVSDKQVKEELNEDYIVLSDTPKVTFEDVKKKYHFENGEVVEND